AEPVSLNLFADRAPWRGEIERRLQGAAVRTTRHAVEAAEHSSTERRARMTARVRERRLSPEVEAVDVAVREIHRPLMRLVVILAGDIRRCGKPARDDGAMRAPERKQIGLRDRLIEVVRAER